jgi:glycosyltransferase involved in cell wall biosynthesis
MERVLMNCTKALFTMSEFSDDCSMPYKDSLMNGTLVIVEPGLKLWGSERALLATLASLCGAWDRVVLVTPRKSELAEEIASTDRYGPVQLCHAPIGNLHKRGRFAQLVAVLSLLALSVRERASCLYLNQAGLFRIVQPIVRILAIPLVVHVRLIEDVPRVATMRGSPRSPVDLIFVSESMIASFDGIESADIRTRFCYDPYAFDAPISDRTPRSNLVCVGRISKGKGQHILIEAMAHPQFSDKDVSLEMFGTGVDGDSYADNLRARVRATGLNDRVKFHGFQRDVLRHLPDFRFLIAPSKYEPLGRVVIEAWEAGVVPIVYAESGGAAEIVRASGGGLIFSPWEPEALAKTLAVALALTDEASGEIAAKGRHWAEETLSLERYMANLAGVLF